MTKIAQDRRHLFQKESSKSSQPEKKQFTFEDFSEGLRHSFREHEKQTAVSCLMKNHAIWNISFGVLLRYIEDFQQMKQLLGLRDGDRVLVLSDFTADAFVTFLVVSANHLTAVMADAAIPDEELLPLIDYCQVSAVFTDLKNSDKMMNTQSAPILLTYGLRSCGRILSRGNGAVECGEPTPDTMAIMFSSGTTAQRKCVEISYASILITHRKIKGKGVLYTRVPDRPMLEVFPMSHVSGLFSAFTLLYEGMSIATVEILSSDTILEGFKVFKPMAFGMVPRVNDMFVGKLEEGLKSKHLFGVYSFLSDRAENSIRRTGSLAAARRIMTPFRSLLYNSNFHCLFSGGASGTPRTAQVIQDMGIEYLDLFASTECGVYIASTAPGDDHSSGSVGNVRNDPYTEVVIHHPDVDGIGEIYVKTDQIMNGYFREREKTAESFDGDYFKTGDLGRIDENGYLYLTGRIKESIVMPNGAKVAPTDMERLISPVMPDGMIYAIAGVPSPEDGGDRIHLFIQKENLTQEEQSRLRESIMQFQRKSLNQYRISDIHFMEEIPATNIGKPKRYLLKEYALKEALKGRPEGTSADGKTLAGPQEASADGKAAAGPQGALAGGTEAASPQEMDRGNFPGGSAQEALEGTQAVRDAAQVERTVFNIVKAASKHEGELTGLEDFKDDLGMDSLSIMEMCTEIESEFSVSVGAFITVIPNARELTDYVLDPIFENLVTQRKNPTKKVNAYLYPVKRRQVHRALFSFFKAWSRRSLDFKVRGLKNVQEGRQYIFCPNHETHFDGLFVWTALGRKCPDLDSIGCMAKAEHLDSKVTKLMMETLGGIPVERTGNTIDSTQRSIDFIKEGNFFLIHPEGTRTRDGRLGQFKEGAAKIAIETGMTIIPVALEGGYEIWPYDQKLPETKDKATGRKKPLTITFCPEVKTVGRSAEEITDEVRRKIARVLKSPV